MAFNSRSCFVLALITLLAISAIAFGSPKVSFDPTSLAAPKACPAAVAGTVADSLRTELARGEDVAFVSEKELTGKDCWRLTGEIRVARMQLTPQEATVELAANLVSTEAGGRRIEAVERGTAKAPDGKPIAEERLIAQAGERAAGRVARQLGMGLRARGQVFRFYGEKQEILVNLGADNNLRRTAELAIMRDGRQVASAQVFSVYEISAAAHVTWTAPGASPMPGDNVLVSKNGPLSAFKEDIARDDRKRNLQMLWATAAMTAFILSTR